MSLNASRNKLATLTKDLAAHWAQTQERWRDVKCREFEDRHLAPLFTAVNAAFTSLENLERILSQIRNDCE